MEMSPKGKAFTEKQEGIVPYIYDDAVYPTRQWMPRQSVHGHLTAGVGHLLSKEEIKQWTGKVIPRSVIDDWFDQDNNEAEQAVTSMVKVPLRPNQFDVLVDFVFNNSPGAFSKSTLLKRVNAREFTRVPAELMKWDHTRIDGKLVVSPGLQKRCADRVAYWNSDGIDITPHNPLTPSGTNVAVPEPKPTSPYEWASLGITGVSGLGALGTVSGFFGVALGIVLIGTFLIGAAIIVKRMFFTK